MNEIVEERLDYWKEYTCIWIKSQITHFSDVTNSAFFAVLSADVTFEEAFQKIIFDDVLLNEGGHYNSSTGIYTAPITGIYQFFAFIMANPEANLYLLADEEIIINPQKSDGDDTTRTNGASGIASLVVGQEVYVETGNRPYQVIGEDPRPGTWFHGYLLSPYLWNLATQNKSWASQARVDICCRM